MVNKHETESAMIFIDFAFIILDNAISSENTSVDDPKAVIFGKARQTP